MVIIALLTWKWNKALLKALDGPFMMIAEEEKKIRRDPLGSASSIISKVFGAIGK